MEKLDRDFYRVPALELARAILGFYLVHITEHGKLVGRIVETEAYMGENDKAAHSYNNKRTKRTEVMFGPPGHAYVYLIYGMYHCFNIVAAETNIAQAVLVRAIEPLEGLNIMTKLRYKKPSHECTKRELLNLTNGPGKLCRAMNINIKNNGQDLCGNKLYLLKANAPPKNDIITTSRINIDYAEEAVNYPYRFYIKSNPYVSVR